MTTRRQFLAGAAALCAARPSFGAVPTAPVAVTKCPSYGSELLPSMQKLFDQLGGLERIVKNKTVAIKVNLTGSPTLRLGYAPLEDTHYTHPRVIAARCISWDAPARAVSAFWRVRGPRRIPIEEYILQANWEPRDILSAAPKVEFENTNWLGEGKKYSPLPRAAWRPYVQGVRPEPFL